MKVVIIQGDLHEQTIKNLGRNKGLKEPPNPKTYKILEPFLRTLLKTRPI